MGFVAGQIVQFSNLAQSELKRLQRLVEADQSDRASNITGGAQHRERICGRAQSNVPDDKFAGVLAQPLWQVELSNIERLRLRHWTDHRMKRLAVGQRMDAVRAV